MRIAIAEVGLDPSIGYLHVCQPGRQALVYDLMEPYRPEVDRKMLAFVRSQTFSPRDFVVDAKGVCRLHPDVARHVALQVLQEPAVAVDLAPFTRLVHDEHRGVCQGGYDVQRFSVGTEQ